MRIRRDCVYATKYFSLVALIVFFGCTDITKTQSGALSITGLADTYYTRFFEAYPEYAYFVDIPIDRHDGVTSNKLVDIKKWEGFEDRLYIELIKIDELDLVEKKDKITYWLLKEELERSKAMRICNRNLWDVVHIYGWQDYWIRIAEFQPVGSEELRQQALVRWKKLPLYIETEIGNLEKGISQGYSMPKEIVILVIDQLQILLDYNIEDSPFMSPALRDGDQIFYIQWEKLISDKIFPAILDYQNYLKNEYMQAARDDISLLALPSGSECYQAYIRNYTTTNKTGDEIFESGKQIVSANKIKVAEVGAKLYQTKEFTKIINRLNEDSSDYFETSEEILETNNKLLAKGKKESPKWFATLPSTEVTIKPYEPHESGRGSYEPAIGDKPAYVRVNLNNPEQEKKGGNERFIYHEAYPGHHLQGGIAKDIEGLHPISKLTFFGSYIEGWARYSEQLAEEMGLYQFKSALIERRAWPARGMVVDTGLHLKGWTKKQAMDYIMEAGRSEATALSIYHRVIIWPAQLTSYDVGGEEIKAFRKLARERLGDKFDIREFHSKILENGSIPLGALRTTIEKWVETKANKMH
jgi:uncharacterized protein (DUF885 family)